jgi:hypothetical protein
MLSGIKTTSALRDVVFDFFRGFLPEALDTVLDRLNTRQSEFLIWFGKLVSGFIGKSSREEEPISSIPEER